MPRAIVYRLTFRGPVHIGERGVALEETRLHVPADTLFSAVCTWWRFLYGATALEEDVLDWFTAGTDLPFRLSSAFPFAGEVLFFPRPLGRLESLSVRAEDWKAYKRVRLVSHQVLQSLVQGQPVQFSPELCVDRGTAWVTSEEMEQLMAFAEEAAQEIVLWRLATVPRVTIDRCSNASALWHFGEVRYAAGAGLWFAAIFNPAHGEEFRQRFESALAALGDAGLGGERNAGRGQSAFTVGQAQLPGADEASHFLTLAPFCPKDASETAALLADRPAYELLARRGWVTSPEGSNLRRRTVWMFAEGSTFSTTPGLPGCLVDVTPDRCPHKVWRYGYAFPVGVNRP